MTVKFKVGLVVLAILGVAAAWLYWPSGPDPNSPDVDERLEAVAELVGRTDEASLRTLGQLVRDPVPRVALAAVRAIGAGRGKLNKQALRKILAENDSGVLRGAAAEALGRFKDTDFRLLTDVLNKAESPAARAGAARGLERLRNPASADRLADALSDPDARVRRSAYVALGRITAQYFVFDAAAPPPTQAENITAIRRALARRGDKHIHAP